MDKRYNHTLSEEQAQNLWQKEQTYKAENNPGELYSIDTPPPTVSGTLHIGHIFSYTQTDIIARYKRMNGYSVYYPFGFDDNGLPTERYVEKKCKIRAHTLSRSEFIKLCLKETKEAEESFKKLWQRIALSVDWDSCYSTISDRVRKLSQESFIELYKKGFIYRKDEPALYCTTCRTSVAQAELDDKQSPSFFNDIVFKDENGNNLIIGTTRPELLPSCVALLYNPQDERYQHLKNKKAHVPLFEHTVPIFEDEQVNIEKGTGLVMVCTFGDTTDILWYKKFDLPYRQSIGFDGKWVESTGFLAGLNTQKAREAVIDELKKHNLLVRQEMITHTVNVHERCKKEIEFVVLKQWFISIIEHKKHFLSLADQINWYPTFMKSRYKNWVENIQWDWCISRQRFYGIPFPVWHCQDCKEIIVANVTELPVDPQEDKPENKLCTQCDSKNLVPDTDVMDTWNTSSLTPYICYSNFSNDKKSPFTTEQNLVKRFMPMSMRPQAHDIIRTWAFYTIIKSWMHHGIIPWKDIVISGHVLSDSKEKLSKSKNNNKMAPATLLQHHSADAIRYWTASGGLGHDVSFSEGQIKIGQRLITKLWNAFIFTKDHISAYDSTQQAPKTLGAINEWLLHTSSTCFTNYQKYLEKHEFSLALDQIEQFFWKNFCDNYLEMIKDQLFNPENYDAETVLATRWTLYTVGLRILQLYAPYLPHITETIYQQIYKPSINTSSLHQTRFADFQIPFMFEKGVQTTHVIIDIITNVRKLKTEKQLSLKTPLASLTIKAQNDAALEQTKTQEQLIKGVTQAQDIVYKVSQDTSPELKDIDGFWHAFVTIT